jgi:hypothetical protein
MTREAIRQRLAAATPGPWKKRAPGWLGPDRHKWRCVFFGPSPDEPYTTSPLVPADADLIAHAPTDLAALLAVADAAAMVGETHLEYDDGICVDCHGWPSGKHDEGCAVPRLLDALAALEAA